MKKIKFLAFTLLIASSSLFAKEMIMPDVPLLKIQMELIELMETPDFELENDISFNVLFSFTPNGTIKVLKIESLNEDVKDYVHQYLDNQIIKTPGEPGKVYRLPLKLKKSDF